jgi:hypothetical protein
MSGSEGTGTSRRRTAVPKSKTAMTKDRKLSFEPEEKILCFHGPLIYEAKVRGRDVSRRGRKWLNMSVDHQGRILG